MDPAWLAAFDWLCRRRRRAPPDADIWDLRWRWPNIGHVLYRDVVTGSYRLSPMLVHRTKSGQESVAMWSAQDALVLKWVSLQIQGLMPRRSSCMHLRGGGGRKCLRLVAGALCSGRYRFVHRTDIRGYYGHIIKSQVISQIDRFIPDPVHRALIAQYVHYSVESGGEIYTPTLGIPRGCALSPLIGGSLLRHVDGYYESLPPEDYFYVRYMDDFLLLTRTRWQLRRGIRELASFFELGGFERHPDKTQTGKVEKGFDWLGLWFGSGGPTVAPRALTNHRERRARLYEQVRRQRLSEEEIGRRMHAYDTRWKRWADSMLAAGAMPADSG
ncbi:RNA-directed DNA polymerase [Cedecea sp.]|uniref:RNA-directed DNA polymerase n=1 Tax=Cedecea sp. TaxID=1970739 RepID=UPI002F42438F